MSVVNHVLKSTVLMVLLSMPAFAQDAAPEKATAAATPEKAPQTAPQALPQKVTKPADEPQSEKKMVQAATINLQTTVTGNQEQPRVLYILPWQNPMTGDVDFESLDNEQKAVFGHVEREELRRELEAAGELQ